MLLSATLLLNVCVILSDSFPDCYSSLLVCVCNHYCRTNQNRRPFGDDDSSFLYFSRFFFLSLFFFFDLLELVSFNEVYFFGEFDNDGSRSGTPGTVAFPFSSVKFVGSACESVGSVSSLCLGYFVLTGIESLGDVFMLDVFVPRGVESKVGQLIGSFLRPKS